MPNPRRSYTQTEEVALTTTIDGKTLRSSFRHAGDNAFVHMVSAWSQTNRVALGQVKTDDKFNEITAIPALLDLIEIKGALVTIDAAERRLRSRPRSSTKGATTSLR